jgi:hypothetical protein
MIHKHQGNERKSNEKTDRGIEKWFPGMLPKALQMLEKVCHQGSSEGNAV